MLVAFTTISNILTCTLQNYFYLHIIPVTKRFDDVLWYNSAMSVSFRILDTEFNTWLSKRSGNSEYFVYC